jgi:hypothetical protein
MVERLKGRHAVCADEEKAEAIWPVFFAKATFSLEDAPNRKRLLDVVAMAPWVTVQVWIWRYRLPAAWGQLALTNIATGQHRVSLETVATIVQRLPYLIVF